MSTFQGGKLLWGESTASQPGGIGHCQTAAILGIQAHKSASCDGNTCACSLKRMNNPAASYYEVSAG